MTKDKKYTNVVNSRPFGSSFIGETSNNKAGSKVVEKEVLDGLKNIKTKTKSNYINDVVLSAVPFGSAYSVTEGLARDYVEGDLTKQNWLTKTLIHSNPNLNSQEFANDELNQFKGDLISSARESERDLRSFESSNPNSSLSSNIFDSSNPLVEFTKEQKLKSQLNDIDKIDSSKKFEFEEISKNMSKSDQSSLANWKMSAPEERRFRDNQKRFSVNEDLNINDPLNKKALAEGNIVPSLNDYDKSHLSDDQILGASLHEEIGNQNIKEALDPDKVDDKGNIDPNSKFNTTKDGLHIEQFGDGTKNTLGLGAGASATGLGIFLNNYWVAIVGVIIFIGVMIYFVLQDKNKAKSKKKRYSSRKSTTRNKKVSNNGSNPINIFLGDIKKQAGNISIPKTKSESSSSLPIKEVKA